MITRAKILALTSVAALFMAPAAFAQTAVGGPGVTPGTGVGPVSPTTGYSESGRGGTGGAGGGATTSGTSDGAGTATGGLPGGYPDRR